MSERRPNPTRIQPMRGKRSTEPTETAPMADGFWGKAWCLHLERYCDATRRLPRGRSLARNGAVIVRSVVNGVVKASVTAEERYNVVVQIDTLAPARWMKIVEATRETVRNNDEILNATLEPTLMRAFTHARDGVFPQRAQMHLSCDCPEGSRLCSHVAATLYTLARTFDADPAALFRFRGTDLKVFSNSDALAALTVSALRPHQPTYVAPAKPKATKQPSPRQPPMPTAAPEPAPAPAPVTLAPPKPAPPKPAPPKPVAPKPAAPEAAAPVAATKSGVRRRSAATSVGPTDETELFVFGVLGQRPEEEMQILGIFQAGQRRYTFVQLQRALGGLTKAGHVLADEDETGDTWYAIKLA